MSLHAFRDSPSKSNIKDSPLHCKIHKDIVPPQAQQPLILSYLLPSVLQRVQNPDRADNLQLYWSGAGCAQAAVSLC